MRTTIKQTRLTIYEMKELEDELKELIEDRLSKVLGHWGEGRINEPFVAEKLKLRVSYVDASELDKDTKSTLSPSIEKEYNGVIRILRSNIEEDNNFSYMHEIVHYLFDVGIGKKVTQEYTRKVKGKTDTKEEQRINYLTAAILMPLNCILEDLKRYDENRRTIDEIKFVKELMTRYGQSKTAIFRRVSEARALSLLM